MNKLTNKYSITILISAVAIFGATAVMDASLQKRPSFDFIEVKKMNLLAGINETGIVKAAQNVLLSFQKGGQIAQINVKVGNQVKKGQLLAKLDIKDASAAVDQANAAYNLAKANYEKIQLGAINEDVALAQTTLNNANTALEKTKAQQQVLVNNAYNALLNSTFAAVPDSSNINTASPTISGTYLENTEGRYEIIQEGNSFYVKGLENTGNQTFSSSAPFPLTLGTKGLYVTFPSNIKAANDKWTVALPNTQAANYVANYNAYHAALQAQSASVSASESAVNSAKAALDLKSARPRQVDLDVVKAQVDAARAQLEAAQNVYSSGIITAPIDGIVTSVDAKIGETASVGKIVVSLNSLQKYQIEAFISEPELAKIKVGDSAQVSLDAYGTGVSFEANVVSIDPAATMAKNIPSYKVTLEFAKDDEKIRSGMNASVAISDQLQTQGLAVPSKSIIQNGDEKFVILDSGGGKTAQRQVKTGIVSNNGYTEIKEGLNEGDKIADFGN
jgi:HlyD family secretion protein